MKGSFAEVFSEIRKACEKITMEAAMSLTMLKFG